MTRFLTHLLAGVHRLRRHEQADVVLALHSDLLRVSTKISGIIFALVFAYIIATAPWGDVENLQLAFLATAFYVPLLGVSWLLNRRGRVRLAGWLYVSAMLIAVVLSDVPAQLIGGRSTISFVLPIIIAGLVIDPVASILLAGLSSLALYIIAWSSGLVFHPLGLTLPFTSLLFFLFSALIWFTMTRLEQALLHLQELNRDLEQRIAARTRELTAANQQLRFMNERLLLHDRSRSAFVMMVSHDLRAPLGAILSNTEMLGLNVYGVLAERQQGVIYRIAHNARSLLRLVDDLLDQSKIEAGQILVLHPVRFAPGELLAETLSALGDLAQAKGLVLTTTLSADLPPYLVGDPQRLLQILLNLTANAIKFTDVGTVRVEIGRQGAEQWWLRVRDTGRGISPEEQAHIFEPFQRGAAADALPGAGLGLSIVNHLVGLMNGEIRLVSAVQQGSEFTIVLPLISSA